MAETRPAFTAAHMGNRARAFTEAFTLALHAEIAETLLTGKPLPAPDSAIKAAPLGAVLLKHAGDISPRQRRKLAELLITRDPVSQRPRPARDQALIRRLLRAADGKASMIKRAKLAEHFLELWEITAKDDRKTATAKLDALVGEFTPLAPGALSGNGTGTGSPSHQNLDFMVERLYCADPTNGEPGKDEIAFTGIALTAEEAAGGPLGQAQSTRLVEAGDGFDTQVVRNFSPPESLWRWDLNGQPASTVYSMTVILAERDGAGGLESIRNDVRDALRLQMAEFTTNLFIAMTAGGYAGTLVGGIIGTAFPVIGTLIGMLLGLLTGATIGAIVALFIHLGRNYDDIFDPALYAVQLDPAALSGPPFYGNDRTAAATTRIAGDGGFYDITTYWQLS